MIRDREFCSVVSNKRNSCRTIFVFQVGCLELFFFLKLSPNFFSPRNTFKRSLSKNYHWCIKSFTGKTYTSWIEPGKDPNFRIFPLKKRGKEDHKKCEANFFPIMLTGGSKYLCLSSSSHPEEPFRN